MPIPDFNSSHFSGTWAGIGLQRDPPSSWKIALTVLDGDYFIDYPSLDCGGTWTLIETADNGAKTFRETLNRGFERCVDNLIVRVETNKTTQQITVKFYNAGDASNVLASGTLNYTPEQGALEGKALALPKPEYPRIARAARALGTVVVQVVLDVDGSVESAQAISGHPLLQAAAVKAARQTRFSPTTLNGEPVKVTGTIIYNFSAQ